jgi:hypothetical protein
MLYPAADGYALLGAPRAIPLGFPVPGDTPCGPAGAAVNSEH